MSARTGLCLGGPADGRTISSERDVVRLPYPASLPPDVSYPSHLPVASAEMRIATYLHYEMAVGRDRVAGFWLCEGIRPEDVLQRLVDGYRRAMVVREWP